MSSNSNHISIHRGNYEEFFILYMDNELTPEQKEMVDQFLKVHPDLQAELEILMSTRLPSEEFILTDKDSLLADAMKMNTAEEELLLYIDGELGPEKESTLKNKLEKDQPLQVQHQLLLKTKLDPTEKITCPDKEELYRRTERRIIPLKMWMSAAAVVLVVGFMGVLYFNNPESQPSTGPSLASQPAKGNPAATETGNSPGNSKEAGVPAIDRNDLAATPSEKATEQPQNKPAGKTKVIPAVGNDLENGSALLAKHTDPVDVPAVKRNAADLDASVLGVAAAPQQIINNPIVTSSLAERNTIVNATPVISPDPEPGDETAKKGSIKGFLRKATRLVERTTGITATNEDGELLIGAVAVKLN